MMSKYMQFSFLIFLILFNIAIAQDKEEDSSKKDEMDIEVVLGLDKHIQLKFIPDRQVQIGNRTILDYEYLVGRKEITLKGIKPGKTNVTLRNQANPDEKLTLNIKIETTPLSKKLAEIKEFLKDVEGVELKIIGESIALDGNLVIPDDIGRIRYVQERYPDLIILVELSAQTKRHVAKKMQDEIHAAGMRQVNVRILNKTFVLEGVVSSADQKTRAIDIAKLMIPDQIKSLARQKDGLEYINRPAMQDFITVSAKKEEKPLPKIIKITAQFVELTKTFADIFGFDWSPWLGGTGGEVTIGKSSAGVTTSSEGTLSAVIADLFPKLTSAQNAGHARVIQQSVLVVKEGTSGVINKQIESVNAIGTGEYQKNQKSQAGYKLNVEPTLLKDEHVNLRINMNSDTFAERSGSQIETLKNNVSTTLIVKNKESAVIGGVFDKKTSTQYNSPSDRPDREGGGQRLFSFVRGKANNVSKAQFVMFITPEIISSASTGTEEIKRKFRRRR